MITKEIAYALLGYIETLYNLNRNLLVLCGTDVYFSKDDNHKLIIDVLSEIPRLMPYKNDKKTNKLILANKDGLLEFNEQLSFLINDYEKILKDNYKFLNDTKKVRNKYEHKLHKIKWKNSSNGSMSLFEYGFDIEGKEVYIYSSDFIKFTKQLNILFSKIITEINVYFVDNNLCHYDYYQRFRKKD